MFSVYTKILIGKARSLWRQTKFFSNFPELRDVGLQPTFSDQKHLEAVVKWLCLAQDSAGGGGVSSHYDLTKKQWGKPYRETTGYIIETFLDYADLTGLTMYKEKAVKMGDWEIRVQCPDGAFGEQKPNGDVGKKVFNTGQVILGLIRLFRSTADKKYLVAAIKAADWLVGCQESDGSWVQFTTQGPRTYHARVAWPLLQVYTETNDKKYYSAALKNIDWVIAQQKQNYWYDNTSLSEKNEPWTHLIAYTISGLLECYLILGKKDAKIFDSFYGAAKAILDYYDRHEGSYLPCSFDLAWESADPYSCLTGDAQLAIIWLQIYQLTAEDKFLKGALRIIDEVKATQLLGTNKAELRGGIFGSFPCNGDYAPFFLINWAAKFFADSLLLKIKLGI